MLSVLTTKFAFRYLEMNREVKHLCFFFFKLNADSGLTFQRQILL